MKILAGLALLLITIAAEAGPAGTAISAMEDAIAALQAQVAQLQADLTALAQRVTVLEQGTPPTPPMTYPLTLGTTGTGQGTVDSSSAARQAARAPRPRAADGDYAAGEAVILTATPASGSTFAGWSPAPCAPSFTMPASALTCTAAFTTTTPPPTGAGWQKLPANKPSPATFSFSQAAWDTQRNQMMLVSWEYDPWCFDNVATWAKCGVRGSPGANYHNAGYAYDPHNDRFWNSTASGTEPTSRMIYWQRATGVHVNHSVTSCGMDPAMLYDAPRKRFICFGGWSVPTDVARVMLFPLDPPVQTFTVHNTPGGPLFQESGNASKMTFTRAGFDVKRQRMWYINQTLDLWYLDPAALTWVKHLTTGTKPDKYAVFQRHEQADKIVAWVGKGGGVTSAPDVVRKTYTLDATTLVWSELTLDPVPPAIDQVNSQIAYDPVNMRILLITGANNNGETWALTLGTTPPISQHTLTIQTAGTGSGATTGAGTYNAGSTVAMTASPASGSTFGGWSGHADCTDGSVTMDGNKSCTATFTVQQAGGVCLPTTKQTFVPCTVPGPPSFPNDTTPFSGGSKDIMWTWDSLRQKLVFGLGDSPGPYTGGSGNTMVWTYDAGTNVWATISTFCQAAGTVSPNFPSDYGIMVYDKIRDRIWWLGQGDGFPPGKEGQPCVSGTPQGSIRRNGWMWLAPDLNTWTKVNEQKTPSTGGAAFDSQGDRAINIESENGYVTSHEMETGVKTKIATLVNIGPEPKWVSGVGGWNTAEYTNRVKFAWDDVARVAYIPTIYQRYSAAGGSPVEEGMWMVAVNVATKTATLKSRIPRVGTGGVNVNAYHTMSVWDSVNKRVIFPVQQDTCGKVHHMLVYDPATDTWEETPVPPQTHGATVAYDPVRNVVVLAGHVFCPDQSPPQDPGPTRMWLWRYGP